MPKLFPEGKRKPLFLALLFLGLLFTGTAGSPRQAQAQLWVSDPALQVAVTKMQATQNLTLLDQIKNWAKDIALLGQVIQLFEFLNDQFSKFAKRVDDLLSISIIIKFLDDLMLTKLNILMHNDMKATIIASNEQAQVAKTAGETLINPEANEACIHAVVNSGLSAMKPAEDIIVDIIRKAVANRYRGDKADGIGPQYVFDHTVLTGCLADGTSPKVPFALKLKNAVDLPPGNCVDPDPNITNSLFGFTTEPMMVPPTEEIAKTSSGAPIMAPNYKKGDAEAQIETKRFGAHLFLDVLLAAGPRPTPPPALAASTPGGMTAWAQWNHCAALENAYVLPIAAYMAKFTRPNCIPGADPNHLYDTVCKATQNLCKFAQNPTTGGKLKDLNKSPAFKDCDTKGLSTYQMEYLSHLICLSLAGLLNEAGGGAPPATLTEHTDLCANSWSQWQTQLATERSAYIMGMVGLYELRDCWPRTSPEPSVKSPTSTLSSAPGGAYDGGGTEARKASARSREAVAEEQEPAALPVKMKNGLPVGVPVSADEIKWPSAVAQ